MKKRQLSLTGVYAHNRIADEMTIYANNRIDSVLPTNGREACARSK